MSRLLTAEEAQQFADLLREYQPNDEVLELFRSSNLVAIAGPTGAGKDTLRDSLLLQYGDLYTPILSTTTRPPRVGEYDGQTYHFDTVEGVYDSLQKREFFQAALVHNQQVSCLHVNEIKKLNAQQNGLSILIPSTETELRLIKHDIKTIFLTPPNSTVMRQRLSVGRSLDQAEIDRRLQAAKTELQYAIDSPHYYCLVTETVEGVTADAHAFIQTLIFNDEKDSAARAVMKQIVSEL